MNEVKKTHSINAFDSFSTVLCQFLNSFLSFVSEFSHVLNELPIWNAADSEAAI